MSNSYFLHSDILTENGFEVQGPATGGTLEVIVPYPEKSEEDTSDEDSENDTATVQLCVTYQDDEEWD